MKTVWNKGLKPEEKAEMKLAFDASALLRNRLADMLKEDIDASIKASRSSNAYDSPSWALTQADAIGYERALLKIISIIS
jgi:hypothetical protein